MLKKFWVPELHKNAIFYYVLTTEQRSMWSFWEYTARGGIILAKCKAHKLKLIMDLPLSILQLKCTQKYVSWKQVEEIEVTKQQKRCIAKRNVV